MAFDTHDTMVERLVALIEKECPAAVINLCPDRHDDTQFKVKPIVEHFHNSMVANHARDHWKDSTVNPKDVVTFLVWKARNGSTKSERANLLRYIVEMLQVERDTFGFPKWETLKSNELLYNAVYPKRWEERIMEKIIHYIWSNYRLHVDCQKVIQSDEGKKYYDACCEPARLLFECQEDSANHADNENDRVKLYTAYRADYDIMYIKQNKEKLQNVEYYKDVFCSIKRKIDAALLAREHPVFLDTYLINSFVNAFEAKLLELDDEERACSQLGKVGRIREVRQEHLRIQNMIDMVQGENKTVIKTIYKWMDDGVQAATSGKSGCTITIDDLCNLVKKSRPKDRQTIQDFVRDNHLYSVVGDDIYLDVPAVLQFFTTFDDVSVLERSTKDMFHKYVSHSEMFHRMILKIVNEYHEGAKDRIVLGYNNTNMARQLQLKDAQFLVQYDSNVSKKQTLDNEVKHLRQLMCQHAVNLQQVIAIGRRTAAMLQDSVVVNIKSVRKTITQALKTKAVARNADKIEAARKTLGDCYSDIKAKVADMARKMDQCDEQMAEMNALCTPPKQPIVRQEAGKLVLPDVPAFGIIYTGDPCDRVELSVFKGIASACGINTSNIDRIIKTLVPKNAATSAPLWVPCIQTLVSKTIQDERQAAYMAVMTRLYPDDFPTAHARQNKTKSESSDASDVGSVTDELSEIDDFENLD